MADDIFCKIVNGEVPTTAVYKDDAFWVIKDINPQAPVHLLVISVRHIDSLEDMGAKDAAEVGNALLVAHRVAKEQGLKEGYRLIVNEGAHGGKLVPHFHVHILGGKKLGAKLVKS